MHGWTFLRSIDGISIPAKKDRFDTEHMAQEVRLDTYFFLNCLLKDEHLFFHLALFSIWHSLLPHLHNVRNRDCNTSQKLGCAVYVYT